MKKYLPITILSFLLTLTVAAFAPHDEASALVYTPDGRVGMEINEVFEFRDVAEAEIAEKCGRDWDCRLEEFYEGSLVDGLRWWSFEEFCNRQLFLVALNPSASTLDLIFQSQNDATRLEEELMSDRLTQLFIGWVDETHSHSDNRMIPVRDAPGFHWFTKWVINDPSWTAPTPDEIFTVYAMEEGFETSLSSEGRMPFSVLTEYGNMYSEFNVKDCMSSPYYKSGMECRAVFIEATEVFYYPYLNGKPAWPNYRYPDGGEDEEEDTTGLGQEGPVVDPFDDADDLKAPDTSTGDPIFTSSVEMPWWLPVLIGTCGFIVAKIFKKIEKRG